VFVISMLAMLHLTAWLALQQVLAPVWAALVVVGADLLLALIFGLLAMRNKPGAAEREAYAMRNTAALQVMRPGPVIGLLAERLLRLLAARLFARAR
jgi:hypothetical protein